jgi:exosortase
MSTPAVRARRTFWFGTYVAVCAIAFWLPLRDLIQTALSSDTYSHILVIPFVSLALVCMDRKQLFGTLDNGTLPAAALGVAGAALGAFTWRTASASPASDWLFLAVLSFLLFVWAGFLLFYGSSAFKAGRFPLLFLLLMLPVPGPLLDRFITWLQVGSADVADWIFRLSGTPFLRQGLVFVLPTVSIEVARECSGIRSAQALLITCLLAGNFFLRSNSRCAVLLAAAVPMLVIKNGIRIATLTLLAVHVDPSFLTGSLHRDGGFVFFGIGLIILLPLLLWLQRTEVAQPGHDRFPSTAAVYDAQSASGARPS